MLCHSVMSESLRPQTCQPLLSTGILQERLLRLGCHALLQGIFPTQGMNPGLSHCRRILYCLSPQGSPVKKKQDFFTLCAVCGAKQCCFGRVQLFETPWTAARQAPLSLGFSRQEDWSGLPCPPPGGLPIPDPGIELVSLVSLALAGRWVIYH